MESHSIIVQALAAGAAAAFRPNQIGGPVTERPLDQKYAALKEDLQQKYPKVEVTLLDIGPTSAERQQTLEAQLKSSGALTDEGLQAQAKAVLAEIFEHEPEAATAVGLYPPDF